MKKKYLIIGGGVIGCALARELLLNQRGEVMVLEKESSVGLHASGRNSGVIHSGINQKPGSMKARMCLEGSRLLREYCQKKNVPMNECGTIVIARNERESRTLDSLMKMGTECGVKGLTFLNEQELHNKEPLALAKRALFSPTGATVDSQKLVAALAEEVVSLGGKFIYNAKVTQIKGKIVYSEKEQFGADHIINCAGLYADKLAHSMNLGKDYFIIPFRGEYLEVGGCAVNSMVYQAPDLRFPFLSIHLTKMTDGIVVAGPTAVLSFGREAYNKQIQWKETLEIMTKLRLFLLFTNTAFFEMAYQAFRLSFSLKLFRKEVEKLIGPVALEKIKPYRSGIRAQMVNRFGHFVEDILVLFEPGCTHVMNCVSPGFTCSLAFAKYMDEKIHS
jgi:(S)-2-hydroxyglutarate dehydrogenase